MYIIFIFAKLVKGNMKLILYFCDDAFYYLFLSISKINILMSLFQHSSNLVYSPPISFPISNAFLHSSGNTVSCLFFRIKDRPFPVKCTIVLKLKCISTYQSFRWTYKSIQSILIILNQVFICRIRSIACHDK